MISTEVKTENKNLVSNSGFMQVDSVEAAMRCAELIAKSSFCPKGMMGKPGDIVIALQMGQELGLKPMQALQNIAVINGRPSLWGDAMLAVCRQSSDFEYIAEEYLEKTNEYICRVKRKNEPEFTQSFSQAKATRARLWGKEGPWTQYPERMLQMRARGFCLRDAFPDLLRGILTQDEAEDMPKSKNDKIDYSNGIGNTIDGVTVEFHEFIDKQMLDDLRGKIIEAGIEEIDVCNDLKIDCLESMLLKDLQGIVRRLDKKISAKRKANSLAINQEIKAQKVTVHTEMTESAKEFFGEDE